MLCRRRFQRGLKRKPLALVKRLRKAKKVRIDACCGWVFTVSNLLMIFSILILCRLPPELISPTQCEHTCAT